MTHFVYPYIKSDWAEINYSLKSINKYFQGKWNAFVVGDVPMGVRHKNVHYIPVQKIRHYGERELDVANKLWTACNSSKIAGNFVWIYDDTMFLDKFDEKTWYITSPLAYGYVNDLEDYFKNGRKIPKNYYQKKFTITYNLLKKTGKPVWDYETHMPRVYNKTRMIELFNKFNLFKKVYMIATLYFNYYEIAPYSVLSKDPIKAEVYKPHSKDIILEKIKGKKILNYGEIALNDNLRDVIKDLI